MKKRLLSILWTLVMAISLLAACGNSNGSTSATQGSSKETEQVTEAPAVSIGEDTTEAESSSADGTADLSKIQGKKVGFTVPTLASDFINYLTMACNQAVTGVGATLQVDACDGDVTKQIEQIENYVTMGMDCIVVFPVNGEALASATKAAVDAGVPVFAFAMEIPNATTMMISAEEEVMGAACGDMASEWIDKTFPDAADGEVIVYVMRGSTQPEIVVRSDSMVEAIKKNPKVTVIEEESENENDQNIARRMTENQFNANPDIDVIIACNAESALGAESFIMSSDSPITDMSKFGIFCVDETDEVDAKILASLNDASALRGTISMGSIADTVNDFMKGLTPILNEETPIARIDGSIFPINGDNIEEYLAGNK